MKKILLISAIALVAAGCNGQTSSTIPTDTTAQNDNSAPAQQPIQASTTTQTEATPPATTAGDSSNAGLSKDVTHIDTEMKGADSDSAGVDSSLNEQSAPSK